MKNIVCGDDSRSWYNAFFFVSVPVKGHRFALFFVDLLFYVGSDSRYTEEAHCALKTEKRFFPEVDCLSFSHRPQLKCS